MLTGYTVAVEFRNANWFNSEKRTRRTSALERENDVVNVVVDAPQDVPNSMARPVGVTNRALGLVRLHGRNPCTWNKKGFKSSAQRFDYEYSDDELRHLAGQDR